MRYIPNGATVPEMADAPRRTLGELGLEPKKYIMTVGRFVPEKGFQDLIAAYARTAQGFKLVIVGGSDHEDRFSKDLRKMAPDHVVFAGIRRGPELAALYRDAALFVLPSYHEGLPIAALEALHAGLPVLLSDIEPNRDIGLPAANYFPVGDVAALAARLSAWNFEGLRIEAASRLSEYDWDRIARSTLSVIAALSGPRLSFEQPHPDHTQA